MSRLELGTFTDYNGLVELLRARKAELQVSNAVLDDLCFFTSGHVDKLIGATPTKSLGAATLGILMDRLGVSGVLFVDPAKADRVATERRFQVFVRESTRIGKEALRRARAVVRREDAQKAGKARWAGVSPAKRREIAREWAKRRWEMQAR